MRLFDIETDGLLETVTRIHCLVVEDLATGQRWSCADQPGYVSIADGLKLLEETDCIGGHNVLTFDLPAIEKLHPKFKRPAKVRDSLTMSRLIWPELVNQDYELVKSRPDFPQILCGSHSLKAWGYRLGVRKGDFSSTDDESIWEKWTPEMQGYCEQDVTVTRKLFEKITALNYSETAIQLEHDFQEVMFLQEQFGFRFDEEKAGRLYAELVRRKEALTKELQVTFPARVETMKTPAYYAATSVFEPDSEEDVRPMATADTKGELLRALKELGIKPSQVRIFPGPMKTKELPFNPGSRDQIAERLQELGWKPTRFTDGGKPQIDEEVLEDVLVTMKLPQAKLLNEYLMVGKRIGQIGEGKNAWLKLVKNGRIHGRVITNGAVTGRCTHMKPNVSQTPTVTAPYGKECRALYRADDGYTLLGADASGLELRALAHYMHPYDQGAYAKVLLEGDIHSQNCLAMGLDPKTVYTVWGSPKKGRDLAKTYIYAYLYGAGDEKLGRIVGVTPDEILALQAGNSILWDSKRKLLKKKQDKTGELFDDLLIALNVKGFLLRASFENKTPALKMLKSAILLTVEREPQGNSAWAISKSRDFREARQRLEKGEHRVPSYKGFLRGVDGRVLHVRSAHSALNTLLQSAGAVAVKRATVILHHKCQSLGWVFGKHYANVAHIHDELQLQVKPDRAEQLGQMAKASIQEAGLFFKFQCPLDGEYRSGVNWSLTH
jgi:DNA polymerase-1